jgi:CHAT domain-containing protein
MRRRIFLLSWFLLLFSYFSLYPGNSGEKRVDARLALKNQQILMEFVLTYCKRNSSRLVTAMGKEALFKIYEIYKKIGNRERVLSFYSGLLDSGRYKNLYPYIFCYLAEFQGKQLREKYLLKSLKASLNDRDRQFALTRLYRFYKQEKIDYLELSYLLKLIEMQKVNRDAEGLGISYRDLGEIHEKKRDWLTALDYYFEALAYSRKVRDSRSGYIYLKISEVFGILNRKELAKMYINKALAYTLEHKDEDLKVMVLCARGKLYYEEEDYPNALRLTGLSLRVEEQRQKYICAISSLYQKALILFKMGEMEESAGRGKAQEAMTLLRAAVEMGLKNKRYDGLLRIMSEYTERLIAQGQLAEARHYLEKIDDIYAPYYPAYFLYTYLNALYFQAQGRMETALQFYRQTTARLEQFFLGLQDHQYHIFREKTAEIYSRLIEFYLDLYNRTENKLYIKKALYFSEIKNSYIDEFGALNNKTYNHFKKEKEKLEQEFLHYNKEYIQLLKAGKKADRQRLPPLENRLESLKRQNEELMELILESPRTYKKYSFKDFNLSLIQQHLNPRQLIVKYAVLKENIYVFAIAYRSIGYWKLPGTTPEILSKVKQLTEPLDDFTKGKVDYLRINYDLQLAHRLYGILVKDLWQFRENIDELFIIPDSELFKLPFEALVTGFNQQALDPGLLFSEYASADYLLEKLPVSYFFSLFQFQKQREPLQDKKYAYTIAAFGNPVISGKTSSPGYFHIRVKGNPAAAMGRLPSMLFAELPSSQKEIEAIPLIFAGQRSKVFLGEEFNRNTFETYAPQCRILHLATHFINNIHYPQYSALLFSPVKNSSPFYYAHEIFNLTLNNELVVLSACESSEKKLLGMQGLRGMSAAFRHAGAWAMMVSMWPVDEHSSELIPLFYREYQQKNMRNDLIPAALRIAKLKLMKKIISLAKGLKISYSHPFLWANYILYHFK